MTAPASGLSSNHGPAAGPTGPEHGWAGPTSLVTSTVGTVVLVALTFAGPTSLQVGGWRVTPILPGLVGLLMLPWRRVRPVAVGLTATLVPAALVLLWSVSGVSST